MLALCSYVNGLDKCDKMIKEKNYNGKRWWNKIRRHILGQL